MGIIARLVNHAIETFVTVTAETVKAFNLSSYLYTPAGDDSVPLKNERLLLVKVGGTGKYVCAGVLTASQGAKPGEKILYARNKNGEIVSKLSLLGDGTVKHEISKDYITDAQGNCKVTILGDVEYHSDGSFSIKGKSMEITGETEIVLKTIGAGMWCPNGVTSCFWNGAPHGGPAMGVVGLKGE